MIWLYALIRLLSIASLLAGIVLLEGLHLRLWKEDKFNVGRLVLSVTLIAFGLAVLSVVRVW